MHGCMEAARFARIKKWPKATPLFLTFTTSQLPNFHLFPKGTAFSRLLRNCPEILATRGRNFTSVSFLQKLTDDNKTRQWDGLPRNLPEKFLRDKKRAEHATLVSRLLNFLYDPRQRRQKYARSLKNLSLVQFFKKNFHREYIQPVEMICSLTGINTNHTIDFNLLAVF